MTTQTIQKVNDVFKNKRFFVDGDHVHKNKLVKCISYDEIKGCKSPGMLVTTFGKNRIRFRVFNLNNLV